MRGCRKCSLSGLFGLEELENRSMRLSFDVDASGVGFESKNRLIRIFFIILRLSKKLKYLFNPLHLLQLLSIY